MIKISELDFSYRKNPLFNNLSLNLGIGTITGLLGKNGAGKTTLLRLLCGLLFAERGKISVAGKNPADRSAEFLSDICFIPEEFYLPPLTPREYKNLHAPFYPGFNNDFLEQAADELQIPLNKKLDSLSYGQKKKYLIAFGLSTNASVTLLDEPTNGLDIPSKREFRKLIAGSYRDDRLFIISTHQVRDVENLIDNIVILDNGSIIFNHTSEETAGRLSVRHAPTLPEGENVLYHERIPDGYRIVEKSSGRERADGLEDLELLFSTVLKNREIMETIFYTGAIRNKE